MYQKSKSKRSETLGNETFLTSPDFYHAPIKFAYMDKRPQSSYVARPSNKFSSVPNSTNPALGPGRYNSSTKPTSQSFHFSKSSRFDSSDFFSKFSQFKKITPSQKEKISERIEKNNKLAGMSKEEKLRILQKNAEKEKIRSEVAKMTRKKLNIIKVVSKSEKTREKFRKFEYRMRLSEIAEIKKFWLVFGSVFTVITSLKYLIILKKQLKKRAGRYLRIFQYISKFLGKMYRIHIKHKYYRGLRIIRIYLTKYVKLWQKQRYRRNRRILVNSIETKLGSIIIKRLVSAWTVKFNTIKRIIRSALFYKVSLFQSLINRWNTCEYEISGESPQNTKRYRKALSIHSISDDKGLEGCLNIPNEIKIVYLKNFIRERILDYLKEYKIFRTHFKSVHRQNIKNRWLLENDIIVEYPIAPDKVDVYKELTLDKVRVIVEKALSEKSTWRNIIFRNRRL